MKILGEGRPRGPRRGGGRTTDVARQHDTGRPQGDKNSGGLNPAPGEHTRWAVLSLVRYIVLKHILCAIFYILCSIFYILYSIFYILYSIFYILYSIFYILHLYASICIYMHLYVYAHICICVYIYIHIMGIFSENSPRFAGFSKVYIYTYMYIRTYTYESLASFPTKALDLQGSQKSPICSPKAAHICACLAKSIHMCVYIYIYIYIYIQTMYTGGYIHYRH